MIIFRSTGMSSCHGSTRAGALHPCSREHASSRGACTLWLRRLDVSAWAWMREFQWCCSTWLCWRLGLESSGRNLFRSVELFPLCFIQVTSRQSEPVYGPSSLRSVACWSFLCTLCRVPLCSSVAVMQASLCTGRHVLSALGPSTTAGPPWEHAGYGRCSLWGHLVQLQPTYFDLKQRDRSLFDIVW